MMRSLKEINLMRFQHKNMNDIRIRISAEMAARQLQNRTWKVSRSCCGARCGTTITIRYKDTSTEYRQIPKKTSPSLLYHTSSRLQRVVSALVSSLSGPRCGIEVVTSVNDHLLRFPVRTKIIHISSSSL
jgi:hypothetical protein